MKNYRCEIEIQISIQAINIKENILSVIVAHHRSKKGEHDHYVKNATGWPNSQNHVGREDLELNQVIRPANTNSIRHKNANTTLASPHGSNKVKQMV